MDSNNILYEQELNWKTKWTYTPLGNTVSIHHAFGIQVQVQGDVQAIYRVQFINKTIESVEWDTTITTNAWTQPNAQYFVDWQCRVWENDVEVVNYRSDYNNKKIWIGLASGALGDTLGWAPFAEEFRKKYNCEVTVCCFWHELFDYPKLNFVVPGKLDTTEYDFGYNIGVHDNDYNKNKNNWRLIPLQQVGSDVLGFPNKEVPAKIKYVVRSRPVKGPYVCISEFSSFYAKRWLNPGGWDTVIANLQNRGYKVMSVSKEPTYLDNVIKANNLPIDVTINNLVHADFYIGVGSGLSVLSWSLGVPTIVVSGFGGRYREVNTNSYRVINESVCHACSDDLQFELDRSNNMFCPRKNDFICSKAITVDMVMQGVEWAIKERSKINDAEYSRCANE